MTQAVIHHPEHETSPWPLLTGMGVLLSALALLAYFPWRMPLLGVVLGGAMLALLAVGLGGWARGVFIRGAGPGRGPGAGARGNRPASQCWLAPPFALGLLFVVLHLNEGSHLAAGGFRLGTNIYAT